MTVNRTTLLDLPLPVTGTEAGTWGDTTNNGLSQYMDIAIAGMNSLTSANFTAGALTIANTLGDSSATNIAAGSAQYATIKVSSLAVNSTITAPSSNRSYRIINADATYSLTIKASGQTGVTFLPGQTGVVAFNGTDYVIVGVVGAGTATDNAVARFDGTTGEIIQNSVVTIADSTGDVAGVGTLTMGGNLTLNGGTANGVLYLNGSKVATSGSALTFDGTNLGVNGTATALSTYRGAEFAGTTNTTGGFLRMRTSDSSINSLDFTDSNGRAIFTTTNHPVRFGVNDTEQMRLTSTGLGIGTSSPQNKLHVDAGSLAPNSNNVARFDTSATTAYNAAAYVGGTLRLNYGNATSSYGGINFSNFGATSQEFFGVVQNSSGYGAFVWQGFNGSYAERMRLDSSGNLGLGVTPSAWRSTTKALQSTAGAIYDFSTTGKGITQNAYLKEAPDAWTYINNGPATQYDTGSGTHIWYTAPSGTAGNAITFTQAMTLDASGNLLVGTTSAVGYRLAVVGTANFVNATSQTFRSGIVIEGGGNTSGDLSPALVFSSSNVNAAIYSERLSSYGGNLIFATQGGSVGNPTERARITSGGYFKASDDGVYAGAANTWHEFNQSANSLGLAVLADNASFASTVVEVSATRNTTNNTYYFLDCAVSGVAYRLRVADSGNVTNTNGSYGTISDVKMKTDIVDAGSQWADIKAIRFRKFKMKDDPSGLLQLGVVAQELEQTSPGLVDEHVDRDADGNDLGTTTKSVKTSILLMKAAKALQEAMARIETLEAKVSALEGN